MNVSKFAVSLQWGKGMHYWVDTDLSSNEAALKVAEAAIKRSLRMKAKNLKPTVHVWIHNYALNKEA